MPTLPKLFRHATRNTLFFLFGLTRHYFVRNHNYLSEHISYYIEFAPLQNVTSDRLLAECSLILNLNEKYHPTTLKLKNALIQLIMIGKLK